jgi:CheY-like chemotaxis protein
MKNTKKILVVDDDVDVQNIIKTILTNEGYNVIIASGKKEGFELLKSEKPDLAILDVMMSTKFEGFELAKQIRDLAEFKNLPLLIQTSIYVLETTDNDIIKYTHELRNSMNDEELKVLLVQNPYTGEAGIDYFDEEKKNVWVSISGFIKKPIESKKLLPQVAKFLPQSEKINA